MKFRAEAKFDISVADYEQLYFDDVFNEAMCRAVRLERKVLKLDHKGDVMVRHTRVAPLGREIPAPVAKAIGASRIEYVEELTYDFGKHAGTWQTISSVLPDKVETKGTLVCRADGDGVIRISEGEVLVKVFGLGTIIEKVIVGDVDKSYEDAARFTREYLARRR